MNKLQLRPCLIKYRRESADNPEYSSVTLSSISFDELVNNCTSTAVAQSSWSISVVGPMLANNLSFYEDD